MFRRSLAGTMVAIFLAFLISATLPAQEQSETYEQEYALYEQAQAEKNVAKRRQIILQFVQEFKESALDAHMSYLFVDSLKGLKQQGEWAGMAAEAEKFLKHRPGDQNTAAVATEAYQQLGQPNKLIQFGTRLYQQSPSGGTAYLVANAYKSINDTANFRTWALRTLKHSPNHPQMLYDMVNSYWRDNDLEKASTYAAKLNAALQGKPESAQARAFALRALGQNAYLKNDYSEAQKQFKQSVELDPKIDFAHLQLGYCAWRLGRVDQAIQSFAKAVALNGASSRDARRELYGLLRTRYGNANKATIFIDAAKKELGIS